MLQTNWNWRENWLGLFPPMVIGKSHLKLIWCNIKTCNTGVYREWPDWQKLSLTNCYEITYICHSIFQSECVLWLILLYQTVLVRPPVLATLPWSFPIHSSCWVGQGMSFCMPANRYCQDHDIKCVSECPVEGVCPIWCRLSKPLNTHMHHGL